MNKLIYASIIITSILWGCGGAPSEESVYKYTTIDQDLPSVGSTLDLSGFLEISDVINLETTDSSLVDFIRKVLVSEDLIFIKGGQSVFKFDKKGRFLAKLSKGNGGPDEFVNLTDIVLVPEQERIWLYDSNQRSIFQYTYDFDLDIDYTLDYPLFGVVKLEKGLAGSPGYMDVVDHFSSLVFFTGQNLATGYKLSKATLGFDQEKSKYLHIARHDYFSKTSGGYNFVNSFNDTIYRVTEDFELNPEFYVDFGNKKILERDLVGKGYTSIVDVFQYLHATDKSFNVGNVVNLENSLIYRFFNQGMAFLSYYNKEKKTVTSGRKLSFEYKEKHIVVELDDEITFASLGNGMGYFVLPSESSVMGENQSLFNVQNGDNPIIVIFHEKE